MGRGRQIEPVPGKTQKFTAAMKRRTLTRQVQMDELNGHRHWESGERDIQLTHLFNDEENFYALQHPGTDPLTLSGHPLLTRHDQDL